MEETSSMVLEVSFCENLSPRGIPLRKCEFMLQIQRDALVNPDEKIDSVLIIHVTES